MGHKSEDKLITPVQDILRIVHEIKEATTLSHSLPQSQPLIATHDCTVFGAINLPRARPLLPSLLEAGISYGFSSEISRTYQQCAEELRQRIEESLATTCREMAGLQASALPSCPDILIRKFTSTFRELYLRCLQQWKEDIIKRVKQPLKVIITEAQKNSHIFNHEYIPLLERFFEENAFPTHDDKVFLAVKSNMQYKQIHVWFQNRRNRTKKEGKVLRKKPTQKGMMEPSNRPYERQKGHKNCTESRALEASLLRGTVKNNASDDVFASVSPPHAFPSPYPPTCQYDPFPCKRGPIRFSKSEWKRSPNGETSFLSSSIDDLVERFSRLNVRDGTRSKGFPKSQSHAATVAITIIPSCAPHPSLVASRYSPPTNIIQLIPSVRAPVSCPKAFHTPSPTSIPVTLIPTSTPHNKRLPPRRCKIAPLPQRLPDRMQNTCRDAAQSEGSAPPSSPHLFSMGIESPSCSLSSVSSLFSLKDTSEIQEPSLFGVTISPATQQSDPPSEYWRYVAVSPPSVP